jgi:multiple sugar transport system ATP-binding protein
MVLSDQIAVMDVGRVDQFGTPDDIYHRPANQRVAQFVGNPRMNVIEASASEDGDIVTLSSGPFHVTCRRDELRVKSRLPAELLLGIRAEEFILGPDVEIGSDSMSAIVGLVEPLGPDTFIELEVGPHLLTARVDPRIQPALGDEIPVSARVDRLHLFDLGSQLRING